MKSKRSDWLFILSVVACLAICGWAGYRYLAWRAFTIEDLSANLSPVATEPTNSDRRAVYYFKREDLADRACLITQMLADLPTVNVKKHVTLEKNGGFYVLPGKGAPRCLVSVHDQPEQGTIAVVLRWLD